MASEDMKNPISITSKEDYLEIPPTRKGYNGKNTVSLTPSPINPTLLYSCNAQHPSVTKHQ